MIVKRLLQALNIRQAISYKRASELARDTDVDVRKKLAGRKDVKPEILYYLAEDKDPQVRRAIAINSATPSQADLLLAEDDNQDVRVGLAEKIAFLAPGLTANEQLVVRKMTYEALQILARDQDTRVRQILSETLKDVADAPPDVIRQLAQDVELLVSGPILEFSPVLSSGDLLKIISSDPISGALSAVSKRQDLGEAVTDAIAASDDQDAIAVLLGNECAQIREETLNRVIERAIDNESWHKPLVMRPVLPEGAAGRLARFVAGNLLDTLTARKDLDPKTAEQVRNIVNHRLDNEFAELEKIPQATMKEARELHAKGELTAERLNDVLQSGDPNFAIAALAVMSGLDEIIILRAISARSARGIVSIAWKASLEPWLVEQLQLRLCKIPRTDVLTSPVGQKYPLNEEEMTWQLNFLKDLSQ